MIIFFHMVWPFVCAIANRIRGGWFGYEINHLLPFWGTTTARMFVSFIISIPLFITYPFLDSIPFFIILYLGFIWGWSPYVAMANPLKDTLWLTMRGIVLTFPSGCFMKLWLFAFSGLLMGIAYFAALHFPIEHKESDGLIWSTVETGELYFGSILGFFMILSILL